MSKPITLFSGYSQRENRTTNYCLLILKMLYEENPKFLAEVLNNLLGESSELSIGVEFRQQELKTASIPDGLILQKAFTIFLETKHFDWFYDDQLEKHLEALNQESGIKLLLALSNFESDDFHRFNSIQSLCQEKYAGSIVFKAVSFEDLTTALKVDYLPKNLADAVTEFREYLEEQDLLPTWKHYIDVVNCAEFPNDVEVGKAYTCPAASGAYNHARCKYFGMYRNKRVVCVAEIEGVVDVDEGENAT